MRPRSLVFDLFGDYLRYRGGEVRLRGLVELMACFDVPEATVRVVVARMRKEGWLGSRREGRETVYTLTDAAWKLLDEGRARIFDRARGPWDGQWHMVVYSVPETERALREKLRKNLAWYGFGPLSAAVWVSPHCRTAEVTAAFADHPAVQLDTLRSRSPGLEADRDMATRAWDLKAWMRTTANRSRSTGRGWRTTGPVRCPAGRRWWNGCGWCMTTASSHSATRTCPRTAARRVAWTRRA